jgi:hypothetical protein
MKPLLPCFDHNRAFLPAAVFAGLAARRECAARAIMRAAAELENPEPEPFGPVDALLHVLLHVLLLSGLGLAPCAAAAAVEGGGDGVVVVGDLTVYAGSLLHPAAVGVSAEGLPDAVGAGGAEM